MPVRALLADSGKTSIARRAEAAGSIGMPKFRIMHPKAPTAMSEQFEDLNQVYYNDYYQFQGRSRWMEKIWSEAFGDNYPEGLHHYGYLTRHDLAVIARRLQLAPGATLMDIGCGKGGPGLWLAQELNVRLHGIDVIPAAVAAARSFQQDFALEHPATFSVGHFYQIPLESQSIDAAVCIDSLWAAPDKIRALYEIRRVMRPGGRLVFTYWDLHTLDPVPYFEHAGWTFVSREDTPGWKASQLRVYEGIRAHEAELVDEMGAGANMLLYEAQTSPEHLDLCERRIYELTAR